MLMFDNFTRRRFLAGAPAAGTVLKTGIVLQSAAIASAAPSVERPAVLGGPKARKTSFESWPKFDFTEEKALLDVLRSGHWYRGNGQNVKKFEEAYAALTGARQVLATCNGTAALFVSLNALGVEPGDEVVVPPYTFIATVNTVLRCHALPVFVDTDIETFQMDHTKLEAAISPATRVIMPVHLGGSAFELDAIGAIAARHRIPLIEDACQAHLAEWKGRKVGTYGSAGCFSFQASKNLTSGEGGAILFNDEDLRERAYAFHNNGSGLRSIGNNFAYASSGANLRLTEFQGALLLAQMARVEAQSKTRAANAGYLTSMLREIPGIAPARQYAGTTNNAYHLYMFRYDPAGFSGLPREKFLKALVAEGVPASPGYSPLNTQPFLKAVLESRGYQRLYSAARLKQWHEQNLCPQNDKLCTQAVWLTQNLLLGSRGDMEQIADAVRKIQVHASDVSKV
jgi:dTDP-4-amino-4,6-dideoxygalactose transaminase